MKRLSHFASGKMRAGSFAHASLRSVTPRRFLPPPFRPVREGTLLFRVYPRWFTANTQTPSCAGLRAMLAEAEAGLSA